MKNKVLNKIMARKKNSTTTKAKKFGTFSGVFTPDVLTILGVIMYLRLGWVVGNAGFLGTLAIIVLAKTITLFTGLSMSSITTNIRIGAGGAYSIISKSLGLEAGGSIGIPLYISQTLSAALYIIGFTASWNLVFPHHNYFLVVSVVWLLLLTASYISAHFAMRIQFFILAIIVISLGSFFFTNAQPIPEFNLIGKFADAGFWKVFAIFFPAVTGIMAGANMSGDLKEPKKSIPLGTISSIIITMFIYIGLAYAVSRIATSEELRTNQMIMVDKALWGPAVIAGIMGATLSSALGSMLGAPRILQALAQQKTVPFSRFFANKTAKGEPRNAILFSGGIILVALLLGNLDFLATLITMFFLITYGMLNLVVFIQQSMKIISFRPTFKIHRIIPLVGAMGCISIMLLINPLFSVVAVIIIVGIYFWLENQGLKSNWGDIRGGLFLALAERASRMALRFPKHQITWKPDLLVPIDNPVIWAGPLLFIRNITYPSGSIFAFTIKENEIEHTQQALEKLVKPLGDSKIHVNCAVMEDSSFIHGAKLVIQTLRAGNFQPNILFLTVGQDNASDKVLLQLTNESAKYNLGCLVLRQHPRMAFGMQKDINLWLRDQSPNWHLAMLIALQLQLNWDGVINLITVTKKKEDERKFYHYLDRISDQARLPSSTEIRVIVGTFEEALQNAPRGDINILGLSDKIDFNFIRKSADLSNSSCLFVQDSGGENVLV